MFFFYLHHLSQINFNNWILCSTKSCQLLPRNWAPLGISIHPPPPQSKKAVSQVIFKISASPWVPGAELYVIRIANYPVHLFPYPPFFLSLFYYLLTPPEDLACPCKNQFSKSNNLHPKFSMLMHSSWLYDILIRNWRPLPMRQLQNTVSLTLA